MTLCGSAQADPTLDATPPPASPAPASATGDLATQLDRLADAGYALGCVTNKPRAFTLPLLEMFALSRRFRVVVSGDDTAAKKPDPAPLRAATEQLGCLIDDTLFVGDSVHDVQAARHAGMRVIGVPYGYNHGKDIREAEPDCVIESLVELPSLLRRKR